MPGTVMVVTAIMAAMVMATGMDTATDITVTIIMATMGMAIVTITDMQIGTGTTTTTDTAAGGAATGMATASVTVGNGRHTVTDGCATSFTSWGRRLRSAPFLWLHRQLQVGPRFSPGIALCSGAQETGWSPALRQSAPCYEFPNVPRLSVAL
jgi:hypothetical protein